MCYCSPDPLADPDVNAGFGDALTAALDVMAFTNDLDLNSTTQPITKSGITQTPAPAPAPSLLPAVTSAAFSVPNEGTGTLWWKTDFYQPCSERL
jgi:hypothetical protein